MSQGGGGGSKVGRISDYKMPKKYAKNIYSIQSDITIIEKILLHSYLFRSNKFFF